MLLIGLWVGIGRDKRRRGHGYLMFSFFIVEFNKPRRPTDGICHFG